METTMPPPPTTDEDPPTAAPIGKTHRGRPAEPNIFQRLNAVANDLKSIDKRDVNMGGAGRFKAFAIDDLYANLRPLFAKHGIVLIPAVVKHVLGERVKGDRSTVTSQVTMDYTFYGLAGDSVTMTFPAEGHDGGDKATNKAVQQALKYALIQLFQISTGEVDPDAAVIDDAAAPSAGEIREKAVKDAAWHKTDPSLSTEERIAEAKSIVAQVFETYGGPPKNKSQVEEMVAYIDNITSTEVE